MAGLEGQDEEEPKWEETVGPSGETLKPPTTDILCSL